MVLVHLPMKNLSCALSVSKHCRDVILGNQELRQKLFLGSTQRKEYLGKESMPPDDPRYMILHVISYNSLHNLPLFRNVIVQGLDQDSRNGRLIVETHPILAVRPEYHFHKTSLEIMYSPKRCVLDYRSPTLGYKPDTSFLKTEKTFCNVIEHVSAEALLCQPAVTKVDMYHHNHLVSLERGEGVTFGMVTEELRKIKVEDKQFLQMLVKSVVKLPCTRANREVYASATELLQGSHDENMCTLLGRPCLRFEVEGAIPNHCTAVKWARERMTTAR